jgi:outer membrane lipoprotein-sorting protein
MSLPLPTRRALLAAGLAVLASSALAAPAAPLSAQDRTLVDKATAYLEGLAEAKGRFVQIDPRGVATQGALYLKRPGKARFAYDPPAGLLVVSDGGNVSIQNSRLKTFESYPLMATPLSLFLAKRIRLDRGVVITLVTQLSDGFSITARDGGKQAEGQITLTFLADPMTLVSWTVADAQGQTTVRLSGLQRVSGLDPGLFVLKDPRPKNPGRARM